MSTLPEVKEEARKILEEAEEYLVVARTPTGYSYIWRTDDKDTWENFFKEWAANYTDES
jgi:hypothetical protein